MGFVYTMAAMFQSILDTMSLYMRLKCSAFSLERLILATIRSYYLQSHLWST